jgi:hypothetical protein
VAAKLRHLLEFLDELRRRRPDADVSVLQEWYEEHWDAAEDVTRAKVEKHIKNTYLKSVQPPVGVMPALKAWMELS